MVVRTELASRHDETLVGNYFVANYPPFSVWTTDAVAGAAIPALERRTAQGAPLGLYVHIPFCRKRCQFCYFKVYTDKNARDIATYLDALSTELELYVQRPSISGRRIGVVYFGGGTPSYLSTRQLRQLFERLQTTATWRDADEVSFECEPGTLNATKLAFLRESGVTRLSIGVESLNDDVLEASGRAHRMREIERAMQNARAVGFPQVNIDLIAGLSRETSDSWREGARRALAMEPDSITVYQLEVPYNTILAGRLLRLADPTSTRLVDWPTKRQWVRDAFEIFERGGYTITSAYTAVRDAAAARFLYRDRLIEASDVIGLGVGSFGHVNGVQLQNHDGWTAYSDAIRRRALPLRRAHALSADEGLVRELIFAFKCGFVSVPYFRRKHGVDVLERFQDQVAMLLQEDFVRKTSDGLLVSREGLVWADTLVRRFFLPQHVGVQYA